MLLINDKINVGKDLKLTAVSFEPTNAYADYKKVEWLSSGENVATVDQTGKVIAKAPGQVTITATAKNGSTDENDWVKQSVDITVLQPVTGFTISGASDNDKINVGKDLKLTAVSFEPTNAYADYKKVEWLSDNTDVATVAEDGKVTALKAGTAKITATAKNGSTNEDDWRTASVDITVLQPVTAVTISGAPANNTMDVGNEFTLTANLSPDDVSEEYQTVEWSSSNGTIATVASDGTVKAIAPGTVTMTATAKNGSENLADWKTQSITITVLQPVTGVTISDVPEGYVDVGNEFTLAASFEPADAYADYKKVAWSSDKPEVATVDASTGKVKAIAPGQVTITATAKNGSTNQGDWKSASVDITVMHVTLNKSVLALNSSDVESGVHEETLQATVLPEGEDQIDSWSSDKPEVATVDASTGKVKAIAPGQATITAQAANGRSASCKVYVDVVVVRSSEAPEKANSTKNFAPFIKDNLVKVSFDNKGQNCINFNNNNGWFFYVDNATTTVTSTDPNITIQKCKFYTKSGSVKVTQAPFTVYNYTRETYTGKDGTGDCAGGWGVNQIDVYFTKNN